MKHFSTWGVAALLLGVSSAGASSISQIQDSQNGANFIEPADVTVSPEPIKADTGEPAPIEVLAASRDPKEAENPEKFEEEEPEPLPKGEVPKLPDYLTSGDFDEATHQQLSFVEFFSPYCSHCTAFFPTWKLTFETYHEELSKLNIQMRQVNCIESGDLCEREEVYSYPSLRLYSPLKTRKDHPEDADAKGSKFVDAFPRTVERTPTNLMRYMKNAVAEFNDGSIDLPSSSRNLDAHDILQAVAGNLTEAMFVMFFPSTNVQVEKSDSTNKNHFQQACIDCFETKMAWNRLSNQVLAKVKTGHVSCLDHPDICKDLGFKTLTEPNLRGSSRLSIPKAVMFLPKSAGIIRIDYKGKPELGEMKAFTNRLYENFQYERITSRGLEDVMDFRKSLPFRPLDSYYPLTNKISVVFFFDIETVTEEDRSILPYLLEWVTASPFNTYLYTAKHVKIPKDIEEQAHNLPEFISYDTQSPYQFNKPMYLSSTQTAKPNIYIFKDNALITSVYQTFAPEDIRDFPKIKDFLNKNQYPLYQELTPDLLPVYFNRDPEQKSYKVVVTFINSNDAKETSQSLYNISLAAHEYYYLKKEYYFNQVVEQRDEKASKVQQLKDQGADGAEIIKEMRRLIPHFYDQDEVLFTFLDINRKAEFEGVYGWSFDPEKYSVGDSIVISKDNRYFWDQDIEGNKLRNEPHILKPVLKSLLDDKLQSGAKIEKKIVGSPYGGVLKFMDVVHDYGFKGYLGLIAAIWLLIAVLRRVKRRGGLKRKMGTGILGGKKD